jgi:hypothetical protein
MAQSAPTYCSILAQEQGFDPIGTASSYEDLILIELPLPWAYRIWDSSHLPADLVEYLLEEAKAREYRMWVLFIAPDAEYCRPGLLRVMHIQRPTGLATKFKRSEYWLPNDEMPALVRAICATPDNLSAWDEYRQPLAENLRDIMVCTHGSVDVVCAKFGFPSYKVLRTQYASDRVRVWRISHFGGHICAPTLLSFPDGRAWAYIGAEQAPHLVEERGTPRDLYDNYRGWALLAPPLAQVVEREVWMREGWAWLDCQVEAEVVAADEPEDDHAKPTWGEVHLHYVRPDGSRGRYEGRVELSRTLDLYGSTKNEKPHAIAQYRVTALEHCPEVAPMAYLLEGTFA